MANFKEMCLRSRISMSQNIDPANNFSRWSLSLACFKLFLDLLTTTNYYVQADAY